VIFESEAALTPGAEERPGGTLGNNDREVNVYEWRKGQLSLLLGGKAEYIGMNADGADVFIRTVQQVLPEDTDFAADMYDFRIGSPGFTPPVPEVPCDPGADQCQGAPTPAPAAPSPTSSSFAGPGNPPPGAAKKQKKAKKNKKKKRRAKQRKRRGSKTKQRKQRGKAKSNRAANGNRGGAK
jgi:hypothetical protein